MADRTGSHFFWVLGLLAGRGRWNGMRIGIDATKPDANREMRSILLQGSEVNTRSPWAIEAGIITVLRPIELRT
jgi:hypothetical protein